jgi:type III pantothenate kinase
MPRTICFDFGNTRLKYAIFEGRELERVDTLESDDPALIRQLLDKIKPDKSILSSVINHNRESFLFFNQISQART